MPQAPVANDVGPDGEGIALMGRSTIFWSVL